MTHVGHGASDSLLSFSNVEHCPQSFEMTPRAALPSKKCKITEYASIAPIGNGVSDGFSEEGSVSGLTSRLVLVRCGGVVSRQMWLSEEGVEAFLNFGTEEAEALCVVETQPILTAFKCSLLL